MIDPSVADAIEGLRFGLDDQPGIRRHGHKRPRYVEDRTGAVVTDVEVLERIQALVIPPAWTDVWISAEPWSHVQATGRDARGRKQYRYHPLFREHQEKSKFDLLVPFGLALPKVRRKVASDLGLPGMPRDRAVALVIELLERTLVRVGNEEYARANGSYGLTTLRNRHALIEGGRLRLHFSAKSRKLQDVSFADPRLAKLVRRCQELPGQILFQYESDEGIRPVRSSDVNDYLRQASGLDATAKTFRTWDATVVTAAALGELGPPASKREARSTVVEVMRAVSSKLNNTPAVCRRSYVHPEVLDSYLVGTLTDRWKQASASGSRQLTTDERRLLHFLSS